MKMKCKHCEKEINDKHYHWVGRKKQYCSNSCKQAFYRWKKKRVQNHKKIKENHGNYQ